MIRKVAGTTAFSTRATERHLYRYKVDVLSTAGLLGSFFVVAIPIV